MANTIPNLDDSWLGEKIFSLPKNNWLYKFACCFLFKKSLTYKEMYLILKKINKHLGDDEAKKVAMIEIINIYNFNKKKES